VLCGDMSIVGPSPHIKDRYRNARRYQVKPGMTGWAQVHGLAGKLERPELAELQEQLDLEYIVEWSVWLDLKIIAKTLIFARAGR
jgi:lipopolysaccharide/colanic/teichoic acid biosynthesis glycosyltransferase